jgi:hypothetical protein
MNNRVIARDSNEKKIRERMEKNEEKWKNLKKNGEKKTLLLSSSVDTAADNDNKRYCCTVNATL